MRTYVSLFTSADGRIYLSLPDLGVEKTWLLKDLLKAGERLSGAVRRIFFILKQQSLAQLFSIPLVVIIEFSQNYMYANLKAVKGFAHTEEN